ncbi:MAG: hypothetical protein GY733_12250 [bacterium]|nr:hypothetical protein [bacterium]
MSDSLAAGSSALLECTLALCEALESDENSQGVERLIEQQLEAFNGFSRQCDPSRPLDPATRRNVDRILELDERVMARVDRIRASLLEQSRSITSRRSQVRAFQSPQEQPPRFVTRRV